MGEIVPSARHRAVIISIIVMMKPSPLRGLSAPTTSFTLLASGQEISSGYVEDNTRSKIHCALKCLSLSDCTAFCSNVSSAGCYLQSHSGSSFVQLPVNTVGTRCYARGEILPWSLMTSLGFPLLKFQNCQTVSFLCVFYVNIFLCPCQSFIVDSLVMALFNP